MPDSLNMSLSVRKLKTHPNRPRDTPCKQQRLRAWQPTFHPISTITCLSIIAAAFIPVGALMVVAANDVVDVEVRYDNAPELRNCPWMKDDWRCRGPCTRGDRACQDLCGMTGTLPEKCPRNFSSPSVLTWEAIEAMADCDPHCAEQITFEVDETIPGPVYLYYKLTRFYQNHRTYVESRSQAQQAGEESTSLVTSDCSPIRHPGSRGNSTWCLNELGVGCEEVPLYRCEATHGNGSCSSWKKFDEIDGLIYAPCGLSAWSMFNDSFVLLRERDGGMELICDGEAFDHDGFSVNSSNKCYKRHVAWQADLDVKFKAPHASDAIFMNGGFKERFDDCRQGDEGCTLRVEDRHRRVLPYLYHGWYMFEPYHRIPSQLDEDFMVWQRTALMPTFRKLYRKIDDDIPPGRYVLHIKHRFNTAPFGGMKYFIISNTTWTGGRAHFMAVAYLVVGSVACILACIFTVHHIKYGTHREEVLQLWIQAAKKRATEMAEAEAELQGEEVEEA